jgi:hypothetical protein
MASKLQEIIDEVVLLLTTIDGIAEVTQFVKLPEEIGRPGVAVLIDELVNETASDGEVERKPQLQLICIGSDPNSDGLTAHEVVSACNAKIFETENSRRLNGKVTATTMLGLKTVPPTMDKSWTAVLVTYQLKFKSQESEI